MKSKKKKLMPHEIVIEDRFLSSEPKENLYITVFLYFFVFLMSGILIFVSFVSMCRVSQTSMLPTFLDGDNVLILKNDTGIKNGDIVVLTVDEGGIPKNLIKRVIATGGDSFIVKKIENDERHCEIHLKKRGESDFKKINEDYIKEPMLSEKFPAKFFNNPTLIDDGMFFALGDNRNNSTDSRFYGSFPLESILGKYIFRIDPNSMLEKLLILIYGEPKN